MSTFDLSTFREILPQPKKPTPFLVVTNARKIRVSQGVYDKTGPMLRLFIGVRGESVVILPATDGAAYKLGKSLHATAPTFCEAVAKEGIAIPARYEMRYIEDQNAWLGTLVPDMKPAENAGKKTVPKKPRKTGLSAMTPPCET